MSVGTRLAAARQNLNLTVEDVAARTRLRAQVIRQIEADNFENLDSDVYIRAHLRTIAGVLHIDGHDVVAEYLQQIGAAATPVVALDDSVVAETNIFRVGQKEALPKKRTNTPFVVAGLIIVVIVIAIAQMVLKRTDVARPIITLSAHPTATSSQSQSVAPTNSNGVDPNIVTLVLKVNQRSWVTVIANNGEKLLSAIVEAGETRAFTDPTSLYVTLGNAPGVEVTVNGYSLGVVGGGQSVVKQNYRVGNPADYVTPTPSTTSESPTPSTTP
jgi:cytoskeleton protein RodZ